MNKPKAKRKQQNNVVIGIIIAAVVVAALLIGINFAGLRPASVTIDYANIPVTRTEDGAFVLGNPEAAFTLVVFEDYNCGHCQSYEPTIKQFIKEYILECAQTGANQVVADEALARSANVTGTPFVLFRGASGELAPVPGQAPSFNQLKAFVDSQIRR